MNNEYLVQMLIARAFLDIRVAANEGNNIICFALSDLFHNVPYQVQVVQKENGDYDEIIDWLKMRADQKNISSWLNHAISECEKEGASN